MRKPSDYRAHEPGDLVQGDTLDVCTLPEVVLKHFTVGDVISRRDVLEVHTRATATFAQGFLDTIIERMPFGVRALQVDGSSEFQAVFEEACRRQGMRLFVLPPRSLNSPGTWSGPIGPTFEEFYEVYDGGLEINLLSQAPEAPLGKGP